MIKTYLPPRTRRYVGNKTRGLTSCLHMSHRMKRNQLQNEHKIRAISTDTIKGTIQKGGLNIAVDQYAEVQRNFTPDDVRNFGILISDNNPIHQPTNGESWPPSKKTPQIVHGMLTASIFSSIFGTLIPGSIYRSQTLLFHSPVYANEAIIGRVQVTKMKNMKKRGLMVTCNTNVYKNYDWNDNITDCDDVVTCISGHAIVWLPNIKVSDL